MRSHLRISVVSLAVALFSLAASAFAAQPAASMAFRHVNVIPMDRDRVLTDQTVVITGDRITALGREGQVKIPKGARQIEATGLYLIPGLTDAHVHLLSPIEFALYLANGVTTVFNLDGRNAHLLWRKQVASGEMLGPTIFTTGPIFQKQRTAEEDVKLVDEQATAGYDTVKVYNQVSKEEYPALIAEAKRKNLLLMGHVARGTGFEATLKAGQSMAHLEEFTYTAFITRRIPAARSGLRRPQSAAS
jgi:cytosine/adenosine deaminase-related metal-dependent hydrolase